MAMFTKASAVGLGDWAGPGIALGCVRTGVLIDLERVDTPIRLSKSLGVVLDEVFACVGLGGAAACRPLRGDPASAEGDIEDLRNNPC